MRDTAEKIRGHRMDMTNTTFICQGQNLTLTNKCRICQVKNLTLTDTRSILSAPKFALYKAFVHTLYLNCVNILQA